MLTSLLAARNADGSPFSLQQLRDNIMTIVIAGHETIASELAWIFQLLAHHPAVRRRLTSEIDRGASTEYLTATIYEALRHRPVFPFTMPREVRQRVEIEGYTYNPSIHLLGCIYLMHHDVRLYTDPQAFRPERFLEGQPSSDTWLPWGGGRRRCPGHGLAKFEMQTILHTTLARLDILPAGRTIERGRWRGVIVTPHAGARVILRRRHRSSGR
jgi:cytochrome P450